VIAAAGFLALLTAAQPAPQPQKGPGWAAPASIYTACAALDLGSTAVAQRHGWHEQNPLLRHPDGRVRWGRAVALKGVQVVGLTLLDREIAKRSKRTAWALRVVAVAVHVAVAAHNTKAAR